MKRPIASLLVSLLFAARLAAAPAAPPLWGELRPGPYAVGFWVVSVRDDSRTWRSDDGVTPSATGPNARLVRAAVWYPTLSHAEALAFGAYLKLQAGPPDVADAYRALDARADIGLRRFVGDEAAYDALLRTPTAAAVRVPPAPGRFPLVAYSAGLNESFEAANFVLAEYLASHGYVVVTVPQLGGDAATSTLSTAAADIETQTRDLELALGSTAAQPFVDRSRVATVGHSVGGVVALLVAMRRGDVDAVVGLDATYGFAGSAGTLTGASGYDPRATRAPLLDLRRADAPLDPSAVDAMRYSDRTVLELPGMSHGDFTSYPAIALRVRPNAPRAGADGYRVACEYVRAFLDATLGRSEAARRFVGRTPAENGLGTDGARLRRLPGLERPPTEAGFVALVRASGLAAAVEAYRRYRAAEPDVEIVREAVLNRLGYEALSDGHAAEAVDLFLLNVEAHPTSANAYDSLADGYLGAGDAAKAVGAYERVLAVLPLDKRASEADKAGLRAHATEQLERLRRPK